MIYPFCFTCERDWQSFELLVRSWERFYPERWTVYYDPRQQLNGDQGYFIDKHHVTFQRQNRLDFGQWCWDSSMCKLDAWRDMSNDPALKDEDYILYADSDTMFHTAALQTHLSGDYMGFPHSQYTYIKSMNKAWTWFSGCLQIARVGKVREIGVLTWPALQKANQEMLDYNLSHNEDVVISFLMGKVGASFNALVEAYEVDPQATLLGKVKNPKLFTHMSGESYESFCGIPIKKKWQIPYALEKAGIII